MRRKILTYFEFINEAGPNQPAAPAQNQANTLTPPAEEDDDKTPGPTENPSDVPATDSAASGSEEAVTGDAGGSAPASPDSGTSPPPPSGDDATATPPPGTDSSAQGAPDSPSSSSPGASGSSVSAPTSSATPAPGGSTPSAPTNSASPGQPSDDSESSTDPSNYAPAVSKFTFVIMNKSAKWDQEYPNGGGVKEMQSYTVSWKDLNKWIANNSLDSKKKEVSDYLLGESDELDSDSKAKLKTALESKTLGSTEGMTEVEFDEDLTPYVSDINTIIVNL